ncbi:MAG: ADP-ribosylation factor-like protein [Promethearchaeota archaeon]
MMDSYKTFLFGLDAAGKTSLSETVKNGETVLNDKPSVAINFDTWHAGEDTQFSFNVWDVPGQISLRAIWRKSIVKTEILIFVLDTANDSKYEEAKKELYGLLHDEQTENLPLIVCYHKWDLEKSKENRIYAEQYLELDTLKDRDVYQLETSVFNLDSVETLKDIMVSIIEKNIEKIKRKLIESEF